MNSYKSPWVTEELEILRTSVRRFFEREVVPHRDRWDAQQHADREVWRKAGELGWLCASLPQEYGGGGGTFGHEAVIIEEQARVGDSAFGLFLGSSIGAHILFEVATEEQRHRWIPRLASGDLILAFALTEPGAGSDAKNIRMTARRDGDHYVLNGSKTFISNGFLGDLVCVVARTGSEPGAKGLSMFGVECRDLLGYRVGRILKKIGQFGQDTTELFFDDCRVPASNLIGGVEGKGFYQVMKGFQVERTLLGLLAVANMERAIAMTVEYTKERQAFGRPLFDLQNTRFKLAECTTKARVCRTFIDDCVMRLISKDLDATTASMAKWWCTETLGEVVDDCLQLFGGYGYMAEYPISRMFIDARVHRMWGGATEIHKEVVARSL